MVPKVPPSDRNVMYENRMLGLPRMRMLKVTNNSCPIHKDFKNAIKVCYAGYEEQYEEKQPFLPPYRNLSSDRAYVVNYEMKMKLTSLQNMTDRMSDSIRVRQYGQYCINSSQLSQFVTIVTINQRLSTV